MEPIRTVTDILQKAEENIHGERVKNYGPATESFSKVATIASVLTGFPLTARNVLQVMQSAKLIRNLYSPGNDDHRIDLCGYVGLEDEIIKDTLAVQMPRTYDEQVYDLAEIIVKKLECSHNDAALCIRTLMPQKKHSDHETELAATVEEGMLLGKQLVHHLHNMGAVSCQIPVSYDNETYEITVALKVPFEATHE